jgi:hypothetical protein
MLMVPCSGGAGGGKIKFGDLDWFFSCLDGNRVLYSNGTGERVALEMSEVDGNRTLTSQATLRVLTNKPYPEGLKKVW